MSIAIGLLTLVALFGSFLLVLTLQKRLPLRHRCDESRDAIRFGVGVVATLSGLVLGLVLSSVKTNFDGVQRDVRRFGTELAMLDKSLRAYGPGSAPARATLVDYARTALHNTWEANATVPLDDPQAASRLLQTEHLIVDLPPGDRAQNYYAARARTTIGDLVRLRATLISEDRAYLPPIFVEFLVLWLMVLFASFGFRAPSNLTVTAGVFLAACSVASAVFLMIELDGAFSGIIVVSSEPLQKAIMAMQIP